MCAVFTVFFYWRVPGKRLCTPFFRAGEKLLWGNIRALTWRGITAFLITGTFVSCRRSVWWTCRASCVNVALPCVPLWKTRSKSPLPKDTVSNQLKSVSSGTANRTNRQKFVKFKTTSDEQSFAGSLLIIFILLRILHITSKFACFQLLVAVGKTGTWDI